MRATGSENKAGPRGLVAQANVIAARFFKMAKQEELPIIQKTYDLILWYVPVINRLPREFKFTLGERVATGLYELLDDLIEARYMTKKLARLEAINTSLDRLRFQTRLLRDFKLVDARRYAHASMLINAVGTDLGGWINQQKDKAS
jgi:hypothetical protein